jgi:hypothetical protein
VVDEGLECHLMNGLREPCNAPLIILLAACLLYSYLLAGYVEFECIRRHPEMELWCQLRGIYGNGMPIEQALPKDLAIAWIYGMKHHAHGVND